MGKDTWPKFYRTPYGDNGTAFRSARLKLMRAEHHLDELMIATRVIPLTMHETFVVGTTNEVVRLIFRPKDMPLQISAAIGDCVHNLRSALDHIAVELTCPPIGQGKPKNTYFPTGINKATYESQRSQKMTNANPQGTALVDNLETWLGGKHLIRELHDLDVADKHKLLVPAWSEMTVNRLSLTVGGEELVVTQSDISSVCNGENFVAEIPCRAGGNAKVTLDKLDANFSIKFQKGQPCEGMNVLTTLSQLLKTIASFVEQCEQSFPGSLSWRIAAKDK